MRLERAVKNERVGYLQSALVLIDMRKEMEQSSNVLASRFVVDPS